MNKIQKFRLPDPASQPAEGLGLLTDEPAYRICWLLNHALNWDLVKTTDIALSDKNSPITQYYPCFESARGDQIPVRLIGNRSREGQWLTTYRQVDFLLALATSAAGNSELDEILSLIKIKIPQIRGLFKIPLPSFCYL